MTFVRGENTMRKSLIITLSSIAALTSLYVMNAAQAKQQKERYDYKTAASKILHRTYVGLKGGVSTPVAFSFKPGDIKELDSSAVYGGIIGYRFNKWFRSDIEISHRHESNADRAAVSGAGGVLAQSTKLSSTYAMLNGYFMLPQMYAQPFLTAGVGLSSNKLTDYKTAGNVSYHGDKKTSFAYQVGAGITFSHENIDFDGTVQYMNHGEARTKTAVTPTTPQNNAPRKVDFKDVVFSIALRYNL